MDVTEKSIVRIDPSSISISDCSEKFRLMNLMGLSSKTVDFKMDYGTCFHLGVAHFLRHGDKEAAIRVAMQKMISSNSNIPESDYRQPSHLFDTLRKYFDEYGEHDQFTAAKVGTEVGVELPFKIPYKSYEHTDVILCGVIDAVGMWNNRVPVFKDIKTTSAYNADTYFRGYEISVQMMLYSWVLKQLRFADHYPAAIIDGVFISKSGCKLQRSQLIEYRPDQIEELMEWFGVRVDELVARIEGRRKWDRNFSCCQVKFGPCTFLKVCSVQEGYRQGVIDSAFTRRVYDPAQFGKE